MNPYAVAASDLQSISAELLLAGAGIVVLLLDAFAPSLRRSFTALALAASVGAAWLAWSNPVSGSSFSGLIESTALTTGFALLVLLAAFLSLLATDSYLRRAQILTGEYHALLLWCCVGLLLMQRSTELLSVFLALELLSICLYALAGFERRRAHSSEAAIKYFLMGAFVSAFVLLGIALLYGETGSTRFDDIAAALAVGRGDPALVTLGLVALVAGFGFKMSVVPFHAWSPDTYQGAPSPFVAFLSVAPKVASAAVLMRLIEAVGTSGAVPKLGQLVAVLAVASMVAGNLLALVQRDIKRMLAYSGIAHMGYLLIPVVHMDAESWRPVFVYLLAYVLMNAGAFALIAVLYPGGDFQHPVSNLSGAGYRHPVLAACLSICMLSLGGIPPLAGFLGKYLVFLHAIERGAVWLAIVGVAASLVGIFYYLRVVYVLYMRPEVEAMATTPAGLGGTAAAILAAGGSALVGVAPSRLLDWLAGVVVRIP